jgi:hypothetical protein
LGAAEGAAGDRREARVDALRRVGAEGAVLEELLAYDDNAFDFGALPRPPVLPLADEAHVATWREYAAAQGSAFDTLQGALVQLRFPIRSGISDSDDYRAVTRAGASPELYAGATGLELEHPDGVGLSVVATAAGGVPVISARGRADFVALLRALAYRNEPAEIPASQGATTIRGYNNWDRIARYRAAWQRENPVGDWDEEFQRLIPRRELYQDRFMLLSDGPYSSLPAAQVGLDEDRWKELSLTVRMHHECTHYATSRLLGAMSNRALDEVIADYFGIVAAHGSFRADWLLAFLGLESFPEYREGGRLQNYLGEPRLSAEAFTVLQRLVHDAAHGLQAFDDTLRADERAAAGGAAILLALASFTLEEMAAPDGADALAATLSEWHATLDL